MATSTSYVTGAVNDEINAAIAWAAADKVYNESVTDSSENIILAFDSLDAPHDAIITDIRLYVTGYGTAGVNMPKFAIMNGDDTSSWKECNETNTGSPTLLTWGDGEDLWGFDWTASQANNLKAVLKMDSIAPGEDIYYDYVQAIISYESVITDTRLSTSLDRGMIQLTSGKISL